MTALFFALQLWAWAASLRILKHVVPFEALVRFVHTNPRRERSEDVERRLEAYMASNRAFPRRAPGNCLERSLGAYRLLCAAGSRPDIVVGVRRGTGGVPLEGHVWLTIDGRPIAERSEFLETFSVVVTYDAMGRQRPVAPAAALAGARFA
jgi:transglutaminase superfamily protein